MLLVAHFVQRMYRIWGIVLEKARENNCHVSLFFVFLLSQKWFLNDFWGGRGSKILKSMH